MSTKDLPSILFLHGFRGGVDSRIACGLIDLGFNVQVPVVNYETWSCETALETLKNAYLNASVTPIVVSHSMGSLMGRMLGNIIGESFVHIMINPSLAPSKSSEVGSLIHGSYTDARASKLYSYRETALLTSNDTVDRDQFKGMIDPSSIIELQDGEHFLTNEGYEILKEQILRSSSFISQQA